MSTIRTERSVSMRNLLNEHVAQRLGAALAKWDGRSDSLATQEVKKAKEKYILEKILEKGAACSANISVATHIAKATHPDLKVRSVTNLNVRFSQLPNRSDIGSHNLSDEISLADTTGDGAHNTAAYELYLMLDLRFEGKPLSAWLKEKDQDAIVAFSGNINDKKESESQSAKYIALLDDKAPRLSSDARIKQLYWCVGDSAEHDGDYHLLQPLFSSSLVHQVHLELDAARFGEQNKFARQARRDGKAYDREYRDYRDLVARKLGGTKPQNISHLNSDRRGVNYLLASLPPSWKQDRPRRLLFIKSVLSRFEYFEDVKFQLQRLLKLLKNENVKPVMGTRAERERIEQGLGQALAAFGVSIRNSMEPGWTRNNDCLLDPYEKLWLDPERASLPVRPDHEAEDLEFQQNLEWRDWRDEVAHRFGNWLNEFLRKNNLPMGDIEQKHWAKQALVDADWPALMQHTALTPKKNEEMNHD